MTFDQDEITVLSHVFSDWLVTNLNAEATNGMTAQLVRIHLKLKFQEPHTAVVSEYAATGFRQAILNLKKKSLGLDVSLPLHQKSEVMPGEKSLGPFHKINKPEPWNF